MHEQRGPGTVSYVNNVPFVRFVTVNFDNGETHRYWERSWTKLQPLPEAAPEAAPGAQDQRRGLSKVKAAARIVMKGNRGKVMQEDQLHAMAQSGELQLPERGFLQSLQVRKFSKNSPNPAFDIDKVTMDSLSSVMKDPSGITLTPQEWHESGLVPDLTSQEIGKMESVTFDFVYPGSRTGNSYFDNNGGFVYYVKDTDTGDWQIVAANAICDVDSTSELVFKEGAPRNRSTATSAVEVKSEWAKEKGAEFWAWFAPGSRGGLKGGFEYYMDPIKHEGETQYQVMFYELDYVQKTPRQQLKDSLMRGLVEKRIPGAAEVMAAYDENLDLTDEQENLLADVRSRRIYNNYVFSVQEIEPEDYIEVPEAERFEAFHRDFHRAAKRMRAWSKTGAERSCQRDTCQILVVVDMQNSYLGTDPRREQAVAGIVKLLNARNAEGGSFWDRVVFTYDWIHCSPDNGRNFACGGQEMAEQAPEFMATEVFPSSLKLTKATDDWMSKAKYKTGFGDIYEGSVALDGTAGEPDDMKSSLHDLLRDEGFREWSTELTVVGTELARCVFKGATHANQREYSVNIAEAGTASHKDFPDNWRMCETIQQTFDEREKAKLLLADNAIPFPEKRKQLMEMCNAPPIDPVLKSNPAYLDLIHTGFKGGPSKSDAIAYMAAQGINFLPEGEEEQYFENKGASFA